MSQQCFLVCTKVNETRDKHRLACRERHESSARANQTLLQHTSRFALATPGNPSNTCLTAAKIRGEVANKSPGFRSQLLSALSNPHVTHLNEHSSPLYNQIREQQLPCVASQTQNTKFHSREHEQKPTDRPKSKVSEAKDIKKSMNQQHFRSAQKQRPQDKRRD